MKRLVTILLGGALCAYAPHTLAKPAVLDHQLHLDTDHYTPVDEGLTKITTSLQ